MAYSHALAERVRHALRHHRGITEKKMFGSVCFLLDGNLLVCVWQLSLIARLGPEAASEALKQDHVREFDVPGRPMKGWIMVEPDGLESDKRLAEWIEAATSFVDGLPGK